METEEKLELKDCGWKDIKCSSCSKVLLHYRIFLPNKSLTQKVKATCPFCKDQSFTVAIEGRAHLGPVGKDEHLPPTIILDIEQLSDDTFLYKMGEGKK